MPKMSGAKPVATPIRSTAAALLMSLGCVAATHAADCPRKGVLGTSRVLAVDPAKFPRVGLKSFPQTLPLRDHEVVLTFDDGPWPPTTPKVLADEIEHGISAVELALHGVATTTPSTPFFRFPGFESTPATLNFLQAQGIAVFGADLWASDWIRLTPQQELKLLIKRLKVSNRGIILLHDPKAQTAAMLPAFLRYLRDNDYHVVHLVPKQPGVDSEAGP